MGTPNLLIAGAARSGTTLLCNVLSRNPAVHISDPKEPHFLAYGPGPLAHTGPGDDHTINRRAVLDVDAWQGLFATPAQIHGEGSVTTFFEYSKSIPRIREFCPSAKIVILLRNPVERAYSAYMYMVGRGFETLSFVDALAAEEERRTAGYQHLWLYAAESRYDEPMAAFADSFPTSQLCVLYYERLMANPSEELGRLHRWLGVDPVADSLSLGQRVNVSGRPRLAPLNAAMTALGATPLRSTLRAIVPFSTRERLRELLLRREQMTAEERRVAATVIGSGSSVQSELDAAPW